MADSSSVPVWIQVVASSGVLAILGTGANRAWKWLIERPLERAEARAQRAEERVAYLERKNQELAAEVKLAAMTARSLRRLHEAETGRSPSVPPPRDELPTIDAMLDLRFDAAFAAEEERKRQQPLNPGRQDSMDYELGRYVQDVSSTPPRAFPSPLEGVGPPRPKRRG